ncbi:MAG: DUF3857 domain-containing protein [Acidobacteria bacterium]|nr:DUF3857 domain-containing protein [Acidobacteriota bacterium]
MKTWRYVWLWLLMPMMVAYGVGRAATPPDAGGVFVFSHKQFWWATDGRLVEDIHHLYTPLALKNVNKFSDYRLAFRPADQRIGVLRAGIHGAEGAFTARETAPAATDFQPADGCRTGRDARLWQRVLSLPVKVGESVEVRWQRMTSGVKDGFSGVEYLQTEDPLQHRKLVFYVPATSPFRYETIHGEAPLVAVSRLEEQDVYAFRFRDLPALPREPAMPPPEWLAARLIYSAFPDWDAAAREFRESYWSQVRNAPQTAAFVRDLTDGLPDRPAVRQQILGFVHHRIRTDDIALWATGRCPLPPDAVLAAKCGDPKDKAMLLGAMLTAAGIPAVPVFIQRSLVPVYASVPAVEQFNGLCLRVTTETGEPVWLDPLDPLAPPGWIPQGPEARGLVVREDAAVMETLPSMGNETHINVVVDVAADGDARFTVRGVLRGFSARQARQLLAGADEAAVTDLFRRAALSHFPRARQLQAECSGGREFSPELKFTHEFRVAGAAAQQAGTLVLVLPQEVSPFGDSYPEWPEEARRTPVFLGPPSMERVRVEIRLPWGEEVLYTPPDEEIGTGTFSLKRTCRVTAANAVVWLEWEIRTAGTFIPLTECPAVQQRLQDFRAERNRLFMVRRPVSATEPASDQGKGRVEIP